MTNFDAALAFVLEQEGGYVDDPSDNGGQTNYGISQAAYPDLDIKNLTQPEAAAIYQRDYWTLYKCDQMPFPVAMIYFDAIVNHGPKEPSIWLQQALGVVADGNIGPKSLAALKALSKAPVANQRAVAVTMTLLRQDFVRNLHNYDKFAAGWNTRYLNALVAAVLGPNA